MSKKPAPSLTQAATHSAAAPPPPDPSRVAHLEIALKWIKPSPTNPRKHFDEIKLKELAESIKSKGVLQPILVRPTYRTGKRPEQVLTPSTYWQGPRNWPTMSYEIVAGERRYRAAQLAGLETIPAIVRDLSDLEVLEVQVVENDQREDVKPSERCDGYVRLVEQHGVAVEDLAARVGKSPATIRGFLKLRKLSEAGRQAVDDGTLSLSTALLIARIPDEEKRADMLTYAMTEDRWDGFPTFRMIKDQIEEECMVELKGKAFDRADPNLVPSAGACTTCPFLAGNNKEDYPDARADLCLRPSCCEAKVQAHADRLVAQAQAKGQEVLTGDKASRALGWNSSYYDLADQCERHPKNKSYKHLVGKDLAEKVVVAIDSAGKPHELVPKKEADPVLKEKHQLGSRSTGNDSYQRDQARREKEAKIRTQVGRHVLAKIVAQVELKMASAVGLCSHHATLFRTLILQTADEVWHETRREVLRRRGFDPKDFAANNKLFAELVEDLDARQLLGLWAELVCTNEFKGATYESGEATKARKELAGALGVDYAAIDKEVRAELKAKAAAKKAKAGKAATNGKHESNGHAAAPKKPARRRSAEEELVDLGLLDSATPQTTSKDYDEALRRSLEQVVDLNGWSRAHNHGATDEEVRDLVVHQWTHGRGAVSGQTSDLAIWVGDVASWCRCKGKQLSFWYDSLEPRGKPTLKGAEVLAEIRRTKVIPQPNFFKRTGAKVNGQAASPPEAMADPDACRVCGCVEERACEGGCYWIEPNLCSACVVMGADPITEEGKDAAASARRADDSRKLKGAKA